MNLATIYSKNPDFVQRDVAGECILVPIRRTLAEANSIYVLNETGAALWNRIDGARPFHEIASVFAEEYDVTIEQLNQDLEPLLADLLSIHAIEEVAVAHDPSR
ncbi:MAG: PqqD family protein [Nitrospira sp.]|nr:MAG: PqqD family protein [Nitrospira sp.]